MNRQGVGEGARLRLADLRARPHDFDPLTRNRFLAGALLPAAAYLQAQRFRAWFRDRMRQMFREVDAILAPATPYEALRIGQEPLPFRSRSSGFRWYRLRSPGQGLCPSGVQTSARPSGRGGCCGWPRRWRPLAWPQRRSPLKGTYRKQDQDVVAGGRLW